MTTDPGRSDLRFARYLRRQHGRAAHETAPILDQRDLDEAVQELKQEPGEGLAVGGVTLPLALADLGLIDEYEFVVHPVVAGHGPTLFAGLSERLDLTLVGRQEFQAGAVALPYQPRPVTA